MEKYEVLAPAGDIESFYSAIQSGADAIYFGLNKFNARMKADNISLDNLSKLVNYAHIKGVKLYVTINTLLSDSEIKELVGLVGECLKCGIDAFIVQDLGVIYTLKKVYPQIVLHGSTQLGVHNVRGARVAKELGLSRVVLSREVTLKDVREIRENVDIELEVFVQGAMCVCFSGNCYLSSLKNGASGNRGLCKQLCRLPFTLKNNKNALNGFALSPRDNCMLDYMQELCEIGVVSFKIEGRLRRPGYVATATRIYREFIDGIADGTSVDLAESKNQLKKVFSRGEFIPGYFNGKNIIDTRHNNHMGEKIGSVVKVEKFKDLFKIVLRVSAKLHSGDGLKVVGKDIVSLGVGNVETTEKHTIIYSKNKVNVGGEVYRVLDSEFESIRIDKSRNRIIDVKLNICVGSPIEIFASVGEFSFKYTGDVVQSAKSRPITKEDIIRQFSKCGDGFELGDVDIKITGEPFMPISQINEYRRVVVENLKQQILDSYKVETSQNPLPQISNAVDTDRVESLAIVDENMKITNLKSNYSALILSPQNYSLDVVIKFYNNYKKLFNTPMLLNLPIIALSDDLKVIDEIVSFAVKNEIVLLANNIYALDYLKQGATLYAGANMNITNNYSYSLLKDMGVSEVVSSIEKWTSPVVNAFRMCKGKRVLMTLTHCPNITLNSSTCNSCSHSNNLTLECNNSSYSLRRYRISNCYFELVDDVIEDRDSRLSIDDLRGIYV